MKTSLEVPPVGVEVRGVAEGLCLLERSIDPELYGLRTLQTKDV